MGDFVSKLGVMLADQNSLIESVFGQDSGRIKLLFVERVFEQTVCVFF